MANYDGSSSLDMTSDHFREHECGPCSLRGRTREAIHYCIDCPDYLCDDCKDYHCTLAVTRNHIIMSGSRIPVSARGKPSLGIICGCNKGQPVAFYCNDHQEIICGACKTFNHHKCKTSSIQEKSSDYKSSKLDSILAEIKSLEVKYERLKETNYLLTWSQALTLWVPYYLNVLVITRIRNCQASHTAQVRRRC